MDPKLLTVMNEQITKELYSSYLYLGMAAYFESETLEGMAHWMKMQAQEEIYHGMLIFNYINERGDAVELGAIDKPPQAYASVEGVFQKTLEHEKLVTASINNIYSVAREVNDNAAMIFLEWLINEQVEEEKQPQDILGKLKHVSGQPGGLLYLDKELGARQKPATLDPAEAGSA